MTFTIHDVQCTCGDIYTLEIHAWDVDKFEVMNSQFHSPYGSLKHNPMKDRCEWCHTDFTTLPELQSSVAGKYLEPTRN
jgi:hypothetical protein